MHHRCCNPVFIIIRVCMVYRAMLDSGEEEEEEEEEGLLEADDGLPAMEPRRRSAERHARDTPETRTRTSPRRSHDKQHL